MFEVGKCAICERSEQLTVEHCPPKSAFNYGSVLGMAIDQAASRACGELRLRYTGATSGRHVKSICAKCNGRTGSWYGTDYRDFTRIAAESRIPAGQWGDLCFSGRPAAVAKQALTILVATSGSEAVSRAPVIKRLIRENKFRCIPSGLRLFVYLTVLRGGHQTGIAHKIDLESGLTYVVAEFAHWPIGWVLSFSDFVIDELCDVSHWLDLEYKSRVDVHVRIPRRWSVTGYPLDYRTPLEVQADVQRNLAAVGTTRGI